MAFIDPRESATLDGVHFAMAPYAEDDGPFLMGREHGQRARSDLEREIASQRTGEEPIAIDFSEIRGMSVPFADAFFVPLLSSRLVPGYYEEHPMVIVNAGPDVAGTVEAVMRQRNLAVVALQADPDAELLGGEPALRETLRVAAQLDQFSAHDLCDRLGLSAQSANNRLKQLVRLGALTRQPYFPPRGGREFRYRVPRPGARHEQPGRDTRGGSREQAPA